MSKILVVEDEPALLELVAGHFRAEGYEVFAVADGEDALKTARAEKPDLCIFDVMLPGMDGLSLCRILRKEIDAPIILLTARGSEADKVIGLESGADDYVVKPFGLNELMARARAALRRSSRAASPRLQAGPVAMDLTAHRVYVNNEEVKLSYKEFELLATLMRNKGAVLTRQFLITQVWGYDFEGDMRTLDVHIRWLREKIERDPSQPAVLQTVRGVGYRVEG